MNVKEKWDKLHAQAQATSKEINSYLASGLPSIVATRLSKFSKEYNKLIENINAFDRYVNKHIKAIKVKNPFENKEFDKDWQYWKEYLDESYSIVYQSRREQKALDYLYEISNKDATTASKYLNYAMANGYRNFFKVTEKAKSQPANNTNRDGDF